MLIFNIQLFEGCIVDQKCVFVEVIMCVMCEMFGCVLGLVDIILIDVKKENWVMVGKLWSDEC